MRDAVALNGHRGVSKDDRVDAERPEIGPSFPHNHRDEVVGYLVQQPELEALSGNRSRGHADGPFPGDLLAAGERSNYAVGDEGVRRAHGAIRFAFLWVGTMSRERTDDSPERTKPETQILSVSGAW